MKYTTVIFDMDGTILYTLDDLTDSANYALKKMGYPLKSVEQVKGFVGNGVKKMLERCMPASYTKEEFDKSYAYFSEYYKVHCNDKTSIYKGVKEVIARLKENSYKTAVVSNKDDYAVKELCKTFFNGLFDSELGVTDGIAKKPAPDLCEIALKELNSSKSEAVYIGDSDVDFMTAKNTGLKFIGISWGFKGREFLEKLGAETVVDNPEEIFALLSGENNV